MAPASCRRVSPKANPQGCTADPLRAHGDGDCARACMRVGRCLRGGHVCECVYVGCNCVCVSVCVGGWLLLSADR